MTSGLWPLPVWLFMFAFVSISTKTDGNLKRSQKVISCMKQSLFTERPCSVIQGGQVKGEKDVFYVTFHKSWRGNNVCENICAYPACQWKNVFCRGFGFESITIGFNMQPKTQSWFSVRCRSETTERFSITTFKTLHLSVSPSSFTLTVSLPVTVSDRPSRPDWCSMYHVARTCKHVRARSFSGCMPGED